MLHPWRVWVVVSEFTLLNNCGNSGGTELATEQELLVALLVILISGGALKLRETARARGGP